MSLELLIKEGTHVSNSHYNGIDRYKLYFSFNRVGSGSYNLNNYRMRGFFKHHFGLSVLKPETGYLAGNFISTSGVISTPHAWYDDWMNDVRPPRIDDANTHFSSEIDIHFNTGTLDGSNASASDGVFELYGFDDEYKTGRYNDVQESYSYMNGSTSYVTNPLNWILERKVSSTSIKSISSKGNIVTVITQTPHGYSNGNAIKIVGVGGYDNLRTNIDGCRYLGNFNITVIDENTFTYITKHVTQTPPIYKNSGICEYWEAHVYETPISSIQGNGSGVITVNTSRNHGLKTNDTVKITGTGHYDGSQLVVTSSLTSTSFTYTNIDNTDTGIETGLASYSSRPPSSAISINYASGYEAKHIIDHRIITNLVYASKDTYINSQNHSGYGMSTELLTAHTKQNINKKSIFYFPVSIDDISVLPYAEINAFLTKSADTYSTVSLYQLSNSSWSDNASYSALNPLIEHNETSLGSVDIINVGTSDLNIYNKFNVDTSQIKDWITGVTPASIAMIKELPISNNDIIHSSNEIAEFKPYLLIAMDANTSVADTLIIESQPNTERVGKVITIVATQGTFNLIPLDNKVTFNGIDATVVYGTPDGKTLKVIVPNVIETTPISLTVNTHITDNSHINDNTRIASTPFSILFIDQIFDATDRTDRSGLTTISGKVSVFNHGAVNPAIYNKDFSYSGFSEITDENSMIQNVYTMLLTGIGERMFNPSFGSTLANRVFSLVADPDALEKEIISEITSIIKTYEFRVKVSQDTSFVVFDENDNTLKAVIGLILPTGNVPVISLSFKTISTK